MFSPYVYGAPKQDGDPNQYTWNIHITVINSHIQVKELVDKVQKQEMSITSNLDSISLKPV